MNFKLTVQRILIGTTVAVFLALATWATFGSKTPKYNMIQEVALYPLDREIPAGAGSTIAQNVFYRTKDGVVSDVLGLFANHAVVETNEFPPCYRLYHDSLGRQVIIYFVPVGKVDEYIQKR